MHLRQDHCIPLATFQALTAQIALESGAVQAVYISTCLKAPPDNELWEQGIYHL